MTGFRRERARFLAVLSTGIACCAATTAQAAPGTGGVALPTLLPPATAPLGYGKPGTRALVARSSTLLGNTVAVRGTMPGAAGRAVILQRRDDRGWHAVARTRVRSSERFAIRWLADRSGSVSLRAVIAPLKRSDSRGDRGRPSATTIAAPVVGLTIFRPAKASFYGPGLFGHETACGQLLTPDLHGVAHRRLPCGTLVEIMYKDREITVPVIDRGPFSGAYSWDLTQATADALGFQASGSIGYVRAKPSS
jgi:rare lipoprotein A